jgi:hypothetical protein
MSAARESVRITEADIERLTDITGNVLYSFLVQYTPKTLHTSCMEENGKNKKH